jgi:hypothetical protein
VVEWWSGGVVEWWSGGVVEMDQQAGRPGVGGVVDGLRSRRFAVEDAERGEDG